jgi:hypothetical protein
MAELPITERIVQAVAERLRGIQKAAGFHTDLGAVVRTEPSWQVPEDAAQITVYDSWKTGGGNPAVRSEREYRGVIEATLPCSWDDAALQRRLVDADIEQALAGWIWQTGALPLQVEESIFLDRPDGLAVVAVQVAYSARWR